MSRRFDPRQLTRGRAAIPLLRQMGDGSTAVRVVIDTNLGFAAGAQAAREAIRGLLAPREYQTTGQYFFATLSGPELRALLEQDSEGAIHRVWPDFEASAQLDQSLRRIQADAAQAAFSAMGEGIVWAVVDSGVDGAHAHFASRRNLEIPAPLEHCDFVAGASRRAGAPADAFGHGTHVAGILCGESEGSAVATIEKLDGAGTVVRVDKPVPALRGVAPSAKIVSLRTLNERGRGPVSAILQALEWIQGQNEQGRRLRIHGVNLSLGYDFDPEWFACGQSPLCVEVNRLARSGVVVVAAAGNTGSGAALSINDPGNAAEAFTVGSTHREMPHIYGVSYFSSKGPTGDGRRKPDLVAPGERIISCSPGGGYVERSGTSMAAPHVSGAIAAFLSVRREYIGRPEEVKRIFLKSALDLGREPYFQGAGLVNLMGALQNA
ncbi:MAG: S8 family peptidase [Bryobacteraceae bacterium]|nr:S8 family peptidase [Bryobacteraceae bacterium]